MLVCSSNVESATSSTMLRQSKSPHGMESSGVDSSMRTAVQCAGCGLDICDRYYLLAVDRPWHLACLTCCECKLQLDSELTCFAKDGRIYCKDDYHRLFSAKRCTRCHLSIAPNELVMKARNHVYHLHCFTCATCNKALTKGEYFGLREDVIYCKGHYEMHMQYDRLPDPYLEACLKELKDEAALNRSIPASVLPGPALSPPKMQPSNQTFAIHHPVTNGTVERPTRPTGKLTGQKGRPKKHKGFFTSSLLSPLRGALLSSVGDDINSLRNQPSPLQQQNQQSLCNAGSDSSTSSDHHMLMTRPKRMRTSFKHHQLRAMKTYFAINHNPDAKDLKQLSQKTGLSKRVLQVWFQNARAKWRRNLLRQRSQGPEIAQDSKPLSELSAHSRFAESLRINSSLIDTQPAQITKEEQNIQTFTNLL